MRYWAKGDHDDGPSDCRETPFDGDAFRLCEGQVRRDHGAAAFVLGVHAYSDSCVISSSTAHKLYPVRVRVLNAITGHDEWLDIAYIPQVTTERGSAGAGRSRLRRIMVLQRMLYLTFRSLISASHIGVPVPGGEHGTLLAFPRLLLYICDQPEERAVLCLKPGMCFRPCSMCDVLLSDLGTPAELHAGEKDALPTILRLLEVHGHHAHAREKQRRDHLEKTLSINRYPPVLAAMAGLGTPPFLLYKIVALDVLHVLDLGITRLLVHCLVHIFPSMCGDRPPLYGSFTATYNEAYRRLLHLGRRSKASRARPGYLVKLDENQTSLTGREQRHGVWILAFLVAGLFDRQDPPVEQEERAGAQGRDAARANDRDDGDAAAHRLLRSLCNSHGEAIEEADHRGGPQEVACEGDADHCAASASTDEFNWGAYRSAFPNTPLHAAVTAMFCEYALLVGRITRHLGPARATPMTLSEGAALAQQAQEFLLCYATPILRPLRTTKVHRLLCHLLHAVRYHGNILNANTSASESRHKDAKKRYNRTNKRANFTRQLVRHAQGTRAVLLRNAAELEAEKPQDDRVQPRVGDDGYAVDSERQPAPLRRARTVHLEHNLVRHLAAMPGLSMLADGVAVPKHVFFQARLEDGRRVRQVLRASAVFHGMEWYDHVLYQPSGTEPNYGQVRLLVRLPCGSDVAIVAELEHVLSADECPLSARGCTNLQWTTVVVGGEPSAARHVKLHAVPVKNITRVVHVVPDSADMCRRLGVGSSPPSFGEIGEGLCSMRYLLNAFLQIGRAHV